MTTARTGTINVKAGDDLQKAINSAQPGDVIILEAGASFTGSFILPSKPGTGWITIQSSALAQLPEGERVTPAQSALMPKLISPGQGLSALKTAAGAHHYRLLGLEFKPVNSSALIYDLVAFGDGSSAQNSLSMVAHHLVLDRCYVHGDAQGSLKRGIALNSAETTISNSYVSEFKVRGQEAQAIMGWNGPGPFHIINNYLEAAGENILFGGADPTIANLVPSDIEIRRNHLTKQLSWRDQYTVKNLFELKNARRVVVDGNVMEYNWVNAQDGTAVLFTVRNQGGTAPWSVVEDVEFTNNVVRHCAAGINLLGRDNNQVSQQTKRIRISNNVFEDVDSTRWGGGRGTFLLMTETEGVVVEHNTVIQNGNIATAYGVANTGFVFRNNIVMHNQYGFVGDSRAPGADSLKAYFPGSIVTHNAIIGGDASIIKSRNMYPVSLKQIKLANPEGGDYKSRPESPLKKAGSDGQDIGCNFDVLSAAIAGVVRRS